METATPEKPAILWHRFKYWIGVVTLGNPTKWFFTQKGAEDYCLRNDLYLVSPSLHPAGTGESEK
jgi:hypothetical protein